jgi:HSP20 family protein
MEMIRMTEVQSVEKNTCQEECKCQYSITPRYQAWSEEDNIELRVVLPGVEKKDIEMKATTDSFMLRAKRDGVLYRLDLDLNVDVDTKKIKAEYHEGLLKVQLVRHNPLDDAFVVPIQ